MLRELQIEVTGPVRMDSREKIIARETTIEWRAEKKYTESQADSDYAAYKLLRNRRATTKNSEARMKFEEELVEQGPKLFYGYVHRTLAGKCSAAQCLRYREGRLTENREEIAEIFAAQFESVFASQPILQSEICDNETRAEAS